MRSELIRDYKTIHTWAGIVTGLALFIAFYAGALTMFEEALEAWIAPPRITHPVPLANADRLLADTLAARPEAARDFTLHLTADGTAVSHLSWRKDRRDRQPCVAERQADGTLDIARRQASGLPQFIDVIHRTAGIPGDPEIGETAMGIVSAIYAVALISGLIVLLPSLIKDFFALRVGKNLKRMWLDAHNVAGVTGLPFHLIIAMTSVVFCLHDPLYALQDTLIYDGKFRTVTAASNPLTNLAKDKTARPMLEVQALLDATRQLSPSLQPTEIQYRDANTTSATARVAGDDPNYLVRKIGFVMLAAPTGEVLGKEYLPGHQNNWSAVVSAFFALHIGTYGGSTMLWVYFGLGLAGAFLFYSGNLLWLETRRRKASRDDPSTGDQSRPVRAMAAATVGVAFGCIASISLAIAAAKWLPGRVGDPEAWHQGIYYAVFLASIVWAFAAGAARSAVHLPGLAGLCTLAIPLLSLIALAFPGSGLWVNSSVLGVDLVATIAGIALLLMAKKAAHRVRHGPSDSIWAATSPANRVTANNAPTLTSDRHAHGQPENITHSKM